MGPPDHPVGHQHLSVRSAAASPYIDAAEHLFNRAVEDAWNADGAPGLVYTTDWDGKPVVHDRMHWTLAEGINTSSTLARVTGKESYAKWYATFLEYADSTVMDHVNGSWFQPARPHQPADRHRVAGQVRPVPRDAVHDDSAARPESVHRTGGQEAG